MKICPNCGKVLAYNSYFGAYICDNCKWEDATIGEKRNRGVMYYKVNAAEHLKKKNSSLMLMKKV